MAKKAVQSKDMRANARHQSDAINVKAQGLTFNATFDVPNEYEFNFGSTQAANLFGSPKTIFVDNGSNPSSIEVAVSDTDNYFTVPPFAQGYFTINCTPSSKVNLESIGGATDLVTVVFYNYEIAPNVWYSYGASNANTPQPVYGSMASGVNVAAQTFKNPILFGAVDAGGIFRPALCDNTGALTLSGVINIAAISIPDGNDIALGAKADAAVTNPAATASLISVSKGQLAALGATTDALVSNPASSGSLISIIKGVLSGIGAQADASITNPATTGSLVSFIKGISTYLGNVQNTMERRAFNPVITSVVSNVGSVAILASNANRRSACIYNDSASASLYIALHATAASLAAFTVKVLPGGYYEVPAQYGGPIWGIWDAAVGNARVTELT